MGSPARPRSSRADAIERTIGSFGTATLALVDSGKRRIRMLSLSGMNPTTKSVRDGTYPEGKANRSRFGHVPLP
jgi:ABC-type molybdate transport system substrate-binding protein